MKDKQHELMSIKFTPPTLAMVKLESAKLGLPEIEAERFHSYFESNGWKVGRVPMKSWTAALNNWRLRLIQGMSKSDAINSRSVYEMCKIMEAKQKLNDELKRRFAHDTATGIQWDNESARQEYLAHAKEIKQLNAQIAGMK